MAELSIVSIPNPILHLACKEVPNLQTAKELGRQMLDTMESAKGCGLSAPQIGKQMRIFVVSENGTAKSGTVFIDPKIISVRSGNDIMNEGCLSIPNTLLPISRYKSIELAYTNLSGKLVTKTYVGFIARIIQHEYDHLDGILITDKHKEQNQWCDNFCC